MVFSELLKRITAGVQIIVEGAPLEGTFEDVNFGVFRPSAKAFDLALELGLIDAISEHEFKLTPIGKDFKMYLQKPAHV